MVRFVVYLNISLPKIQFTHRIFGKATPLFWASLHGSDGIGQRPTFSHGPVLDRLQTLVISCWLHGKVALQILIWNWLFLGTFL
jgi:hypothetical protein